jgi:hypothetical protein
MARALETPGRLTERHSTSEVRALLVKGVQPAIDVDDIQAPGGHVTHLALRDPLDRADLDVGAEAAARPGTEEVP